MINKLIYGKQQANALKGVAILFMLCFHLFAPNTLTPQKGLSFSFTGIDYIIGQFCNRTVPLYIFITGYAIYSKQFLLKNIILKKVLPLYYRIWLLSIIFLPILFLSDLIKWKLSTFLHTIILGDGYIRIWWYVSFYTMVMILWWCYGLLSSKIKLILQFIIPILALICCFFIDDKYNLPFYIDRFIKFSIYILLGLYCAKYHIFDNLPIINKNKLKTFAILSILIYVNFINLPDFMYRCYRIFTFPLMVACFIHLTSGKYMSIIFGYLGRHSTNIWLIHGFFYYYFYDFVYSPRYWILILIAFLALNIFCSIMFNQLINRINSLQKIVYTTKLKN